MLLWLLFILQQHLEYQYRTFHIYFVRYFIVLTVYQILESNLLYFQTNKWITLGRDTGCNPQTEVRVRCPKSLSVFGTSCQLQCSVLSRCVLHNAASIKQKKIGSKLSWNLSNFSPFPEHNTVQFLVCFVMGRF